jgi:hypothetical protein
MSTVGDVSSLAATLGPTLSGLAAVLGVVYVWRDPAKKEPADPDRSPSDGGQAQTESGQPPRRRRISLPAQPAKLAQLALLLAGLEGVLAALLIVIVGATAIGLDRPAVHVLEWSVLTTFAGAIALACLSLPEAIFSYQEQLASRTVYRAVTSLLLAICALIASVIVGTP